MAAPVLPALSEGTVLTAWRRHRLVALAPLVFLLGLAGVLAFGRTPVYKAQARMSVGSLSPSGQNGASAAYTAQTLAAGYSRIVTADSVIIPVARRLRMSRREVIDHVRGSLIPASPIFFIEAEGPSEREAVQLANLTARSLERYVLHLNRGLAALGPALRKLRAASAQLQRLRLKQDVLRVQALKSRSAAARRAYLNAALNAAAASDVAQLEQQTAGQLYGLARSNIVSANQLQLIAPANRAKSDRASVAELLFIIALVAGLILGVVLAVYRFSATRAPFPDGPLLPPS
jgi:capsular polysaccharide biosynthesis protein